MLILSKRDNQKKSKFIKYNDKNLDIKTLSQKQKIQKTLKQNLFQT